MRFFCAISFVLLLRGWSLSQPPAEFVPAAESVIFADLNWEEPFAAISPSEGPEKLVLVLITNDDPFVREDPSTRSAADPLLQRPALWCAPLIAEATRHATEIRADLPNILRFQNLAAGLPLELTGGGSSGDPSRAVTAICDADYRLLSLAIGVPDSDELLTLLEDAEEVRRWIRGNLVAADSDRVPPRSLAPQIAQRSRERTHRLWHSVIDEVVNQVAEVSPSDRLAQFRPVKDALLTASLCETLQPTYLVDAQLKFGLNGAGNAQRLTILEQHVETRRDWCEAAIVALAGSDYSMRWRPLITAVWNHPPVTDRQADEQLVAWFNHTKDTSLLVLSIEQRVDRFDIWPPAGADTPGVTWKEAHDLAMQFPHRKVDLQELALLVRQCDLPVVDLRGAAPVRYIVLTPNRAQPTLVRESEPPGRFASRLKRSRSERLAP